MGAPRKTPFVAGLCCIFALVLVALAVPARAERATPILDDLELAVEQRLATLADAADPAGRKAWKAARKAQAWLARDADTLTDELRVARTISRPLRTRFAEDDEIQELLEDARLAFDALLVDRLAALEGRRAKLSDSRFTKKAAKTLARAEARLGRSRDRAAGDPLGIERQIGFLHSAAKLLDKAEHLLTRASGSPVATRIVVHPAALLLPGPGETAELTAEVQDQYGRAIDAPVAWRSTKAATVEVAPDGTVVAHALGSAQIYAEAAGLASAPVLAVVAVPVGGAIAVADEQVVRDPEPVDEDAPYGVGFAYTVVLRDLVPRVGDLLFGTGEKPVGGEVVAVELLGSDTRVTLEIVPLDVLFDELVIDETIPGTDANTAVPDEVAAAFEVDRLADGTWVFVEKEAAASTARTLAAREAPSTIAQSSGTTAVEAEVGPFSCTSDVAWPLGLDGASTFQLLQTMSIDLQYSTENGLERLVANGEITAQAVIKPRLQTAVSGKVACRVQLLGITIPVPGPLALVVGTYVPIGVGFEVEGTVNFANLGVDITQQATYSAQVGIDCTSGECTGVGETHNESSGDFRPVVPNPVQQFQVSAAIRGFGYFEVRLGNPLWQLLQIEALEGKAGREGTITLAPLLSQLENPNSASEYRLAGFASVGTGVEIQELFEALSFSIASFEARSELELARSPTGSFSFGGPGVVGGTVHATLQLASPTFLGIENVQEVRFYRKDGSTLIEKASVPRTSPGQTTYVGEWQVTPFDVGASFAAVVVTELLPVLGFEVENNSLRVLEAAQVQEALTRRVQRATVYARDHMFSDQVDFRPSFSGDLSGPSGTTIDFALGAAAASATQQVDVVVSASGALESIVASGSSETAATPPDASADATQSFLIEFVLAHPTQVEFSASTALTNVVEDDRTVRLWLQNDQGEIVACSEGEDTDAPFCPGGAPSSFFGTLPPGAYALSLYSYVRDGTDLSYQGMVVVLP
jgi:hypothetical protein